MPSELWLDRRACRASSGSRKYAHASYSLARNPTAKIAAGNHIANRGPNAACSALSAVALVVRSKGIIPRMEESKTCRSYYARIIEFPDLACNAHLFPGRMLNLINSESQQTATYVGPISRSGMFQFLTGSALFVVTLAIIFFGLIRYRLRDIPPVRDEGQ